MDMLNTREKAAIIWALILLVWVLCRRETRNPIWHVLKSFFQKKILVVLAAMLLYVGLVVSLFREIGLWDVFLAKDTLLWIVGVAFVLLMNADKTSRKENHFTKIALDNLKLILVLEFVVNLYAFSLWVEMILVPLLFVIVGMGAVAGVKREYVAVKRVVDSIMAVFGTFLLLFALFHIFTDYQALATSDNLRAFLLPPLLTFAYLPFLYFFSVYITYEILFVRVDVLLKRHKALAKFVKRKILALCHVNLRKLNRFAKESTPDLVRLNDEGDVLRMITKFRGSLARSSANAGEVPQKRC